MSPDIRPFFPCPKKKYSPTVESSPDKQYWCPQGTDLSNQRNWVSKQGEQVKAVLGAIPVPERALLLRQIPRAGKEIPVLSHRTLEASVLR